MCIELIQVRPAVQQCPIAPGASFTYQFRADLYGTSWYHSHYSGQYAGGLFGPMVIYGPKNVPYDVDLGPIMLVSLALPSHFQEPPLWHVSILRLKVVKTSYPKLIKANLE